MRSVVSVKRIRLAMASGDKRTTLELLDAVIDAGMEALVQEIAGSKLEACDTADWKSALRERGNIC